MTLWEVIKSMWGDFTWFGKITLFLPCLLALLAMAVVAYPLSLIVPFIEDVLDILHRWDKMPEWMTRKYHIFIKR